MYIFIPHRDNVRKLPFVVDSILIRMLLICGIHDDNMKAIFPSAVAYSDLHLAEAVR